MTFNKEDIESVKKLIEIKNKGYYADGKQVTDLYNRVLQRNVTPTNCGSCIRNRIKELEDALKEFEKTLSEAQETISTASVDNVSTSEDNKPKKGRKTK